MVMLKVWLCEPKDGRWQPTVSGHGCGAGCKIFWVIGLLWRLTSLFGFIFTPSYVRPINVCAEG